MPHLSQTFESYQRVKIYTYSVNDLGLNNFYSNMIFTGILQFANRTLCPENRLLHSVLNVLYFLTAYYSVYGVNSYTNLNRNH